MTIAKITKEFEVQKAIHETAIQIQELIAAAVKRVRDAGGDGDDAENRIIELVTEE